MTDAAEMKRRLAEIEEQLEAGKQRMDKLQAMLDENTAATKRIDTNTAELVSLFGNLSGAFKVLEGLGKLAKPLAALLGLGAAAVGLWHTLKGGFHIGGK